MFVPVCVIKPSLREHKDDVLGDYSPTMHIVPGCYLMTVATNTTPPFNILWNLGMEVLTITAAKVHVSPGVFLYHYDKCF